MRYVLMCGGYYEQWETPKQLQVVNGERIVERTIRLLKENGCKDIVITSNNEAFDGLGVPRLEHENSYRYENGKLNGYWVDAFYPKFRRNQKATFIFGDVFFTEEAIKQIVEYNGSGNVLFGSKGATVVGKVWGEPFAYAVNDMGAFYDGIKEVKKLQDEGKTDRVPIVWELYRVLNGIDVNTHRVLPDTYKVIDDGTNDCDSMQKLEALRDRFEKKGNVFTVFSLNSIGGGESFLYYMAKKYADRDITIYYQNGDAEQVERMKKYARVIQYNGQKIKCEKVFFNYNLSFIENIEADEYYQIIHADYKAQKLKPKDFEGIKYIAVSKTAAEAFTDYTGLSCEVSYNPIKLDNNKPLILMSATRLTKGKGKERIDKMANILEAKGVQFLWFVFTNDTGESNNLNVVYMKPRLDITDYLPLADWFVQLTGKEINEAYCYSVVEANKKGVPCIMTDCPVFKELGIQGITVDLNLSDLPIDKIKNPKRVKYQEPKDDWGKVLSKKKSNYIPPNDDDLIHIRINHRYKDSQLNRFVEQGEELTVTRARTKVLRKCGVRFLTIKEVKQ